MKTKKRRVSRCRAKSSKSGIPVYYIAIARLHGYFRTTPLPAAYSKHIKKKVQIAPVVVHEKSYIVYDGNHRVSAAIANGLKYVPVVFLKDLPPKIRKVFIPPRLSGISYHKRSVGRRVAVL